jgi:Uma2 family endonuclease
MASLPQAHRISYEEWLRMPENKGEEVVNGEIRIMPPPSWNHSEILDDLTYNLRSQVNPREVKVKASTFGLLIRRDPLQVREPDLALFLAETVVEKDGIAHSAPQLVVEVLSPSNTRREREQKLADYASIGVPEVWVFSPEARTVEVLHLENSTYRRIGIFAEGTLKPLHFPNVQIDIARIWPD